MNQEYVTVERYKKLVDFVNELVQNYNNLERRITALEKQTHEAGESDLQKDIAFEAELTK
jgi:uncharacterized protein YjcR